jgi:hypothetical protein
MLPYRLRPPNYGKKLQAIKNKDGEEDDRHEDPYRNGGPLQRAITADLMLFYQSHFGTTQSNNDEEGSVSTSSSSSLSFETFKIAFRKSKIAMLHRSPTSQNAAATNTTTTTMTGFVPPRCDHNAHSQLLYAACLDLLRRHMKPPESSFSQAACAIFCLYALYETNPLPDPSTISSIAVRDGMDETNAWLQFLPMGIQHRTNPKLIYRRNFRQPIRIDWEHYGYLLELRDLAQSVLRGSSPSSSLTILAKDVEVIINKLIRYDETGNGPHRDFCRLEFCAYTGPCGLEGFAGHTDYPFPHSGTSNPNKDIHRSTKRGSQKDEEEETTAAMETEPLTPLPPFQFSNDLEHRLIEYTASCQSIRMPPLHSTTTPREKRIRQSLLPMFQHPNDAPNPVEQLLEACRKGSNPEEPSTRSPPKRRIKLRHVTFGSVQVHATAPNAGSDSAPLQQKHKEQLEQVPETSSTPAESLTEEDTAPAFDLILPSDLSSQQQQSLQCAVETILLDRREGSSLQFLLSAPPQTVEANHDKDGGGGISTIGENDGGISTVSTRTSVTDAGQKALNALFSEVKRAPPPSSNHKVPAVSHYTKRTRDFFLTSVLEEETSEGHARENENNLSDLSSDEEEFDDEASVAASRVGQRALEMLLSTANRQPTLSDSKEITKAGGQRPKASGTVKQCQEKKRVKKPVVASRDQTRESKVESEKEESETESWGVESESLFSAISNRGRTALDVLLSQAVKSHPSSVDKEKGS